MPNYFFCPLDLTLFESGGGGTGGDAGGDAGGGSPAAGDAQQSPTVIDSDAAAARRAEFERLIKGDYKDLFDERVKRNIDSRFKQTKSLEEQVEQHKAFAPVLDAIASKYGVDAKNAEAMLKALDDDASFYEDEAAKRGLTVDQYKEFRKIERENENFRRAEAEAKRKANADQVLAKWNQQAEACKQYYGDFDLGAEVNDPDTGSRFVDLLKAGIDVQTAYEVIHKNDLLSGAMRYTAAQTQQKVVNDIRARGMRPQENGSGGSAAAAMTQKRPSEMTRKEREAFAQRAMRGERITFKP